MIRVLSQFRLAFLVAAVASLGIAPLTTASAQDNPPPSPIDIPCAENMSSQLLGSTPIGDGDQTLVLARVIFGPGGSLGSHTHPGTLVATVETGTLGFTLLEEGEMVIERAATAESDASETPLTVGEEESLEAGDWFVEVGMIHSAQNLADEETSVLLSGLIETGEPLTSCVSQDGTPEA